MNTNIVRNEWEKGEKIKYKEVLIHKTMVLLLLTITSPVGLNRSGRIFANYFLLIFIYLSIISFCIYNCCFLWYFIIPTSTTPMAARKMAPKMAFLNAILLPALKASNPPVTPPAIIWFKISYLFLIDMRTQLDIENNPAHNPKEPYFILSLTSKDRSSFFEQHDSSIESFGFWRKPHSSY